MVTSGLLFVLYAAITLVIVSRFTLAFNFINKNRKKPLSQSIANVVVAPAALLFIIMIILLVPVYTPTLTLKNDEGQQLTFIGMVHLGNHGYYQNTHKKIMLLRANGAVILHEGIGSSGTVNYSDMMCAFMQPNLDNTLIRQPNCIGNRVKGDYFADITMETFMRKFSEDAELRNEVAKGEGIDAAHSVFKTITSDQNLSHFDPLKYLGVKLTTLHFSIPYALGLIPTTRESAEPVILGFRNKVLTNAILKHNTTATAYGLAHLSGVIERLQEHDETWHISATTFQRAF
jgi:hypothetical protein